MRDNLLLDIAISVNNISKIYKLYNDPLDRFKESLHPFKKKYHKEFYALNDFSMEIKKGEIVGIIGKNGCGKSTLLKVLTGVLTPSSGSYHVNGKISALLELGSGFNPERTGLENVIINGIISGFSTEEMEQKAQEIIEFADIGDFIYQPVKTYSSGMYARLAFGVAINIDPEILIIDEILAVGDAAFQRKCFAKIEAFKNEGKTILFVSHSEGQIVELCDRAIWVNKGANVVEGKPKFVTGLYLKYSDLSQMSILELQDEYNLLIKKEPDEREIKNAKLADNQEQTGFFSQELVSKSKIHNEINGAKITNVKLLTLSGNEVNVICRNKEYVYSYDIEFLDNFSNFDMLKVSMLIKNQKGVLLTGKGVPLSDIHIESVLKGSKYQVKWRFENLFNQGIFFFNCAVNLFINGEKVVLHRIQDAYMVKVLNVKENRNHGVVDFRFNLLFDEITGESL